MFRDILLPIGSGSGTLPASGLVHAAELTRVLGGRLTTLAVELDYHLPSNVLANAMLDLPGMVAAARHRAQENTRSSVSTLQAVCARLGLEQEHLAVRCLEAEIADEVTRRARLRDLTAVVAPETSTMQQYLAETVVFGSGRPVLVVPRDPASLPEDAGLSVGMAWDGSRPAARALADALPLLRAAASVTVVTVHDEKALPSADLLSDVGRHLSLHGIAAETAAVSSAGRPVGAVLGDVARGRGLDLLVMGAYAHSRMRDFVLGGATRSMVAAPPVSLLLSH